MNYVQEFLAENRDRLGLARHGLGERLRSVVLTPRFRASSHVVFLILNEGCPEPVLVAKAPRLRNAGASLKREADGLQCVQRLRPEGFDSIPRLVAFEKHCGRPLLIVTALLGRPMDPPFVRRTWNACCRAAIRWLVDLRDMELKGNDRTSDHYERLVERPFDFLAEVAPFSKDERKLLAKTRELVEPLRGADLPTVLEHGDFSHPNVMMLKDGSVGVVDWETANPRGLPVHDLVFFLAYASFARQNSRQNGQFLPAIDAAFFRKSAWARGYVADYAERLQLAPETLTPLFLLCWVRYMAGLLERLRQNDDGPLGGETVAWLRQNRYYGIWQHTLNNIDRLRWN